MQDIPNRTTARPAVIETYAPARLDRLPWGRFHTLVVIALGITWVLDGLEVTLAGSVAGALKASPVLHFTDSEVGLASSFYLGGAVSGALVFGWLADRLGRRLLFFVTLWLYLLSAAATAFSWDFVSFCLFRFLTGAGIGGEYSAVNSTIQEMIPARFRGWTDLALGGTFWLGGALGAVSSIVLLDPANINPEIGWRLGFFIGAVLSLGILVLRSFLPESPRWLVIHGREEEAEKVVGDIEAGFRKHGAKFQDASELKPMRVHPRTHTSLAEVFKTIFVTYRTRALVALTLMATQAFFYNAIFFTYALVLTKFYNVPVHDVGWYILPFALANVLGPLILGPLFELLGPQADDRFHLCDFGRAARGQRLAFRAGPVERDGANHCLGLDLLLRIPCRRKRLSHRKRGFSGRDSRARYSHLLRAWDGNRRGGRALSTRKPDRDRRARQRLRRLPSWLGLDDFCCYRPGNLGRLRRA